MPSGSEKIIPPPNLSPRRICSGNIFEKAAEPTCHGFLPVLLISVTLYNKGGPHISSFVLSPPFIHVYRYLSIKTQDCTISSGSLKDFRYARPILWRLENSTALIKYGLFANIPKMTSASTSYPFPASFWRVSHPSVSISTKPLFLSSYDISYSIPSVSCKAVVA